jgi:hypothetical protein
MKRVELSQKQKIALIIGGGVLTAFLLKRIYRAVTNKGQASSINTNEAPPPTRPPGYFNLAADAIEQAVFDVGTDENSIFRVFADLNGNGDFVALFNAYGIRGYFSFATLYVNLNLTQTLQEELTRAEITELNNLLAARNITYRI